MRERLEAVESMGAADAGGVDAAEEAGPLAEEIGGAGGGGERLAPLAQADQADIAQGWQRILATVRSYADVEPSLSGRIEELIDFVTIDG